MSASVVERREAAARARAIDAGGGGDGAGGGSRGGDGGGREANRAAETAKRLAVEQTTAAEERKAEAVRQRMVREAEERVGGQWRAAVKQAERSAEAKFAAAVSALRLTQAASAKLTALEVALAEAREEARSSRLQIEDMAAVKATHEKQTVLGPARTQQPRPRLLLTPLLPATGQRRRRRPRRRAPRGRSAHPKGAGRGDPVDRAARRHRAGGRRAPGRGGRRPPHGSGKAAGDGLPLPPPPPSPPPSPPLPHLLQAAAVVEHAKKASEHALREAWREGRQVWAASSAAAHG